MKAYWTVLRARHWTKNGFCLIAALVSERRAESSVMIAALVAFGVFCAAASAVYIINDLFDRERDRLHPRKRLRPIAAGQIGASEALGLTALLLGVALFGAWLFSKLLLLCVGLYLFNNLLYNAWLKQQPVLDVLGIAVGFVVRLLAGSAALGESPSPWLALLTFFLACFLGFAKRFSELARHDDAAQMRPVLASYSQDYLAGVMDICAVLALINYAPFATSQDQDTDLFMTLPIVCYAVLHYKRRVLIEKEGEAPERLLLEDPHIWGSILLWLLGYLAIIYGDFQIFRWN